MRPRIGGTVNFGFWVPFALAVFAYLPTLTHAFAWDDGSLIVGNPAARSAAMIPEALGHGYGWAPGGPVAADRIMYYRPLVTLANTLTWVVSGGRPWLFHLENVLAHAGVSVLVSALAAASGLSPWSALAAGALFALHPVASEPVAWVSGRTDVFAAFFVLLCLWLLVRRGQREDHRGVRALPWGASAAFVLALASKESGYVLLLLAPLALLWGAARARRPAAWAVLLVPAPLFTALRFGVLGAASASGQAAPKLVLSGNLFLHYLRLVAAPWPLVTEPPAALMNGTGPLPGGVAGLALFSAGIAAWAWLLLRSRRRPRARPAALGLGLFLAGLAPVLQWIPTGEIYGERFLYLPLAGLILAVACAADRLVRGNRGRALAVAGVLCAVSLVPLEIRLPDWRNDLTLYGSAARRRPENARALANYGSALAANGRVREGGRYLARAATLDPRDPWKQLQYGAFLLNTGKVAEAAQAFERAWNGGLRTKEVAKDLGVAWTRTGRSGDAVRILRPVLDANPADPELADALGMAERKLGHCDSAAALFRRSLDLAPARPGPWMNLIAMLALECGRTDEAARTGTDFLRRFPGAPETETVRRLIGSPPPRR